MSAEPEVAPEVRSAAIDETAALVSAFEAKTLPRESWTHHAHLTIALWYLTRHDRDTATNLIRRNIKAYNLAHGILTTRNSGYHETMTLFFIHVVCRFMESAEKRNSFVALLHELLATHGNKGLPFDFYSKERLMSWEARSRWLAPDLRPLD